MMDYIDVVFELRRTLLTAIYPASPIVPCWLGDLKPWSIITDTKVRTRKRSRIRSVGGSCASHAGSH